MWYGVNGYIVAWAITEMAMLIAGVPADIIVGEALKYTPITFIIYLLFVWAADMKKIKRDQVPGHYCRTTNDILRMVRSIPCLTIPGKAIPV